MYELQKELNRLRENCKKIDSYFDDDMEALNYCKTRISSLNEEIEIFDNMASKFGDIISNYDDYKNCFVDYINEKYIDFGTFLVFQLLIFVISLILITSTLNIGIKLIFVFIIIIFICKNVWIYNIVCKKRENIAKGIYSKYGVDIAKLTEEDIDDMEMSLLQDKVRSVNLRKEIDEYEFYFNWKMRMIEIKEFDLSNGIEIEES